MWHSIWNQAKRKNSTKTKGGDWRTSGHSIGAKQGLRKAVEKRCVMEADRTGTMFPVKERARGRTASFAVVVVFSVFLPCWCWARKNRGEKEKEKRREKKKKEEKRRLRWCQGLGGGYFGRFGRNGRKRMKGGRWKYGGINIWMVKITGGIEVRRKREGRRKKKKRDKREEEREKEQTEGQDGGRVVKG